MLTVHSEADFEYLYADMLITLHTKVECEIIRITPWNLVFIVVWARKGAGSSSKTNSS